MKALFTFVMLITLISYQGLAQDASSKNSKQTIAKGKDDNCMLQGSYGAPLPIEYHEKSSKKIEHQGSDYIQFNENGTYKESINGTICNGTWGYNYETHSVTVSCNGVRTYKVSRSAKKLELSGNSDKYKLRTNN